MPPTAARDLSIPKAPETVRPPARGRADGRPGPQRDGVGESHIRQIAPALGYRPPAPPAPVAPMSAGVSVGRIGGSAPSIAPAPPRKAPLAVPAKGRGSNEALEAAASDVPQPTRPSAVPKARISLAAFAVAAAPTTLTPVRRAPSPRGEVATAPSPAVLIPGPPPLPREAVVAMPTTELAFDEIDYGEAYAYDAAALHARVNARSSIVPAALLAVAADVRESLAPAGRVEAARELRSMRRASFSGLAFVLREVAAVLDRLA